MTDESQMLAALLPSPADHGRIKVGELPAPKPGPHEVLVQARWSEVNHVDRFIASGAYATALPFPFVVGRDIVGRVAAVGSGVDSFSVGDKVWSNSMGHDGRQGTFAQFAVVPADRLYPLPDEVSEENAASVLQGAGTAYLGLVREARLTVGEVIFIGGAGGAVGSAAVQIAVAMGATVIAATSQADVEWIRSLGAHVALNHQEAAHSEVIRRSAPNGVDVWWDTGGTRDLSRAVEHLARRGRLIVSAGLEAAVPLPVGGLYTKDVRICGFAISNASVSDLRSAALAINTLLREGRLVGRTASVHDLADVPALVQTDYREDQRGRTLIRFSPSSADK